ncbi:MAG TPA: calcium-binding protein [Tepidisphaeraceae bacterium]|nr:calcium-binding protein [Tepidisphaeraceae bacterium]
MRPDEVKGFAGDEFPNFEEERRKRRRPQTPRGEYRPGVVWGLPVEALERRRLFATVSFGGNVVTVTGDSDGSGEDIWIAQDSSGIFVMIDGTQTPSSTWYSNTNVNRIDVFGNGDGDNIIVESSTAGHNWGTQDVAEIVKIEGGSGNDTVWAGDGADTVYGGDGADDLRGTDGNDLMYGGGGADTMDGGDDNDNMYGGDDADSMLGGTGNDVLTGDGGNDTLDGLAGNDSLHGAADDDRLYSNDDEADLCDGGSGTDYHLDAQDDNDTLLSIEFP